MNDFICMIGGPALVFFLLKLTGICHVFLSSKQALTHCLFPHCSCERGFRPQSEQLTAAGSYDSRPSASQHSVLALVV